MKINTLLPAIAFSIAAVPVAAMAQVPHAPAAHADNVGAKDALASRIATMRTRIADGRRDGRLTRTRAARLGRRVAQVRAGMIRLDRAQGFVSAAELATYDRTLGDVDAVLDRYGVARSDRGDGPAAGPGSDATAGLCRKDSVAALIGHPAPDDETLKRLTGSRTIRRLAPGAMATKDYRVERLTVYLDDTGKVAAASCG